MGLFKIAVLLFLTVLSSSENNPLKMIAQWKNVDYQFPNATTRQEAIDTGKWIAQNTMLLDVDVYFGYGKPKIFVTIPKFQQGVPITLGTVSAKSSSNGPLIVPYPNYSWHSSNDADCNGITSVFRVAIDKCNRLWVLDTGRIGETQFCPPQILVFNLKNDSLLRRYRFPNNQYKCASLFVTPIVDVRDSSGTCVDTMVYIADVTGFGILMYSYKNNVSWRAENKLMYPDPHYGTYNISGETFNLMDGILGISVSGQIGTRLATTYSTSACPMTATDRVLYFHSLAAETENIVPLRYLDNKALWDANVEAVPYAFIEIGSRGIQSAAQAMDSNGNLFFGLCTPNAIACWDSNTPYCKPYINIRAESELKLQFASGVKIVTNAYGKEELWIMTCRLQKVFTGSMNFAEINFRIQAAPVTNLLNGRTRCFSNMNYGGRGYRGWENKFAFERFARKRTFHHGFWRKS